MKTKVIMNFSRLTDDELSTKGDHILQSMNANSNYPQPTPTLEQVATANSEYHLAFLNAKDGGRELTAIKNQKRKVLEDLLTSLGLYVELNCRNDLAVLLSSGFNAKRDGEPVGILEKPVNFKITNATNSGSVRLSVDPIKGAQVYFYQWTMLPFNDTTIWESELGHTSILIRGLIPGREYAFKVCGKGAAEEKVYSDTLTRFVA